MEYVPGTDLEHVLQRERRLDPERVGRLLGQLCSALQAAHNEGIIHRDLKPANIMITPDGRLKVLDFGLAKAMTEQPKERDSEDSPTVSSASTLKGLILGTAAYMSPEQAKGLAADRRSDVWAFGVVLLELLTGQRAFAGDTASEVLAAVLLKEPAIPAGLSPPIERLLRRCLRKDPRHRLQAIGEARIAIAEAEAGVGPISGAPSKPVAPAAIPRAWWLRRPATPTALRMKTLVPDQAQTILLQNWLSPAR
jgi:serine/threonine-protein kinase